MDDRGPERVVGGGGPRAPRGRRTASRRRSQIGRRRRPDGLGPVELGPHRRQRVVAGHVRGGRPASRARVRSCSSRATGAHLAAAPRAGRSAAPSPRPSPGPTGVATGCGSGPTTRHRRHPGLGRGHGRPRPGARRRRRGPARRPGRAPAPPGARRARPSRPARSLRPPPSSPAARRPHRPPRRAPGAGARRSGACSGPGREPSTVTAASAVGRPRPQILAPRSDPTTGTRAGWCPARTTADGPHGAPMTTEPDPSPRRAPRRPPCPRGHRPATATTAAAPAPDIYARIRRFAPVLVVLFCAGLLVMVAVVRPFDSPPAAPELRTPLVGRRRRPHRRLRRDPQRRRQRHPDRRLDPGRRHRRDPAAPGPDRHRPRRARHRRRARRPRLQRHPPPARRRPAAAHRPGATRSPPATPSSSPSSSSGPAPSPSTPRSRATSTSPTGCCPPRLIIPGQEGGVAPGQNGVTQ